MKQKLLLSILAFVSLCLKAQAQPILDFRPMQQYLYELTTESVDSQIASSCTFKGLKRYEETVVYHRALEKLLNVNDWNALMNIPGESFELRDRWGYPLYREARKGDLVEIELPLDPTLRSYWVIIEDIERTKNSVNVAVRPTKNPRLPYVFGVTDHFFTDEAVNNFKVELTKTGIKASVKGLNEIANITQVRHPSDKAFNNMIAQMAWGIRYQGVAKAGFQKLSFLILTGQLADCEL